MTVYEQRNSVVLHIIYFTFHLRKFDSLRATEEQTIKPHTRLMNQQGPTEGLKSSQPPAQVCGPEAGW